MLVKKKKSSSKEVYKNTFLIRIGARLPGIKAVEMMMSTSFACLWNNSISALMYSADISLA